MVKYAAIRGTGSGGQPGPAAATHGGLLGSPLATGLRGALMFRTRTRSLASIWSLVAVLSVLLPGVAQAQELDSGDTAWMLTATALVLFMPLPGLALFYGGLVRSRNVLSVFMHII